MTRSARRTIALGRLTRALLALLIGTVLPVAVAAATTKTPHGSAKTGTHAKRPTRPTKPVSEQAKEARTYEDFGAYGQAADALRRLRHWVPPDADLEIELALDEARSGQLDSASARLSSRLLTQALKDTLPVSRRVPYPWGRDLFWVNGRFDGWHWYIVRGRVEVAAARGHWKEALEAARGCVAARPLAGVEWLILAICAGRSGSSDEAQSAVRQAILLDPTLPEARYLNGILQWRGGQRSAAQESFRQAVALDSMYRQPALALVRLRLPSAPPDSLPNVFLNGIREAGLITSSTQPKLEEFIQMDSPPSLVKREMFPVPDSLSAGLSQISMSLPVLVDSQGRIVYHELPWVTADRLPPPVVGWVLESLPQWQFTPARKLGSPRAAWSAVSLSYKP